MEQLEDRYTPATLSDGGTSTLTIALAASENLAVVSNGGTYAFSSNQVFSNGGVANTGDFSAFGSTSLTLNGSGLTRYSTINITDNGASASVTFGNSGANAYSDHFTVTLDQAVAGTVFFNGNSSFGGSNLQVTTSKDISVSGGSLTSTSGNLTLTANQQVSASSGNFRGVNVFNATIGSTTGNITLTGRGGNDAGGFQYGVGIFGGGVVGNGTSGVVTVNGVGGAPAANLNVGVYVTGTNSRITSGGGAVSVSGTGGGSPSSATNYGVFLDSAGSITAGGSGAVTVTGNGGPGSGNANTGVYILTASSMITSSGGNVSVTGTGGHSGTNGNMVGVTVQDGQITAGGSGTVTVQGTGGTVSGVGDYGVLVTGTGLIASTGGAVSVTGTGTSQSAAVAMFNGATISSGGSANLTINADSLSVDSTSIIRAGTAGDRTATLLTRTAGTNINLGGADGLSGSPLTLGLTDAELDRITAATIQIGNAVSGAITVSAAITYGNHLSLTTGAGITVNQAVTMAANKNLTASAVGTISLSTSTSDLATSGTGTMSLTTNRDIAMLSGSSVTTVNGALTLSANQQASPTAGNFMGINLQGATVSTTGTGNVTLNGEGGVDAATAFHYGIYVVSGAVVSSTSTAAGAGTITLNGVGGNGAGSQRAVYLLSGQVTSQGANISLTGVAGTGALDFNIGVDIVNSTVSNTGSGAITVTGTGGAGAYGDYGISVWGSGSNVTSVNGDIRLTGTGAAGGVRNHGVVVNNTAIVQTTGTARIIIDGTGGNGTDFNTGFCVGGDTTTTHTNGGTVTSAGGNIQITGRGGPAATGTGNVGVAVLRDTTGAFTGGVITNTGGGRIDINGTGGGGTSGNFGVHVSGTSSSITSGGGEVSLVGIAAGTTSTAFNVDTAGTIGSGGTGPLTISANSFAADATAVLKAGATGTGTATITANTVSTLINMGGADVLTGSPLTLGITDAELDRITAGTLQIGNVNSAAITVSAAITHANNLSLTTGAGITVNQPITMAVDKNLTAAAIGTINLAMSTADLSATGTGAISLTTNRDLSLTSGSSVTTANGAITLSANQATPTAATFVGVTINNALVQATGSGNVTVLGKSGNGTASQIGVVVTSTTASTGIRGGTSGVVTVTGTSVATSGNTHYGVQVTGAQGIITTSGATINVTGTAGGGTTGTNNVGVNVDTGGQIFGSAATTVNGTGGQGSSSGNSGVMVNGSGAKITSSAGGLTITGVAATTNGSTSSGVDLTSSGSITTTGAATLTIAGTGAATGTGTSNYGVWLRSGTTLTSASGAIQITGTPGGGSPGFRNESAASTTAAAITVIADSIDLASGSLTAGGAGAITLRQKTNGTLINLGGADVLTGSPLTLGLTDTELDSLTASAVQIGNANSGAITASADITRSASTSMSLFTGGDILLSGGQVNTGGGTLLLDSGVSPAAVKPTKSGVDVTAATLTFAGSSAFVINGTAADTQYTQLNVVGQVDLTGAALALSGSFLPVGRTSFTLVNNDGADAIIGTFVGFAEGATLANFLGSGLSADITYKGGDGNDVVVTVYPNTLFPRTVATNSTGFRVTLSRAVTVADVLNLYDYRDGSGNFVWGAADVELLGPSGSAVAGSVAIAPGDTDFTFVATGGALAAGNYSIKLRSASNGFHQTTGELLDGNADGTAGDDYTSSFTVNAPPANAVTVSVPNFARGPQQAVNVPASSALGLPIQVSDGANLTALQFDLAFDAGLLDITNVAQVGGGSATLTPLSTGRVRVSLTFSTPLATGAQTAGYLTAAVPTSAASRYGERAALDLSNLTLTVQGGGNIPGIDDDAVEVNAYFGDIGRNGRYDSFDVQQASRLAVRLDSGFQQHPLLDPTILSDFNGNSRIDSFDVQRLSRLALRLSVTEAPDLPSPLPTTTDTDRLIEDPPPEDPPKESQSGGAPRTDVDGNGSVDAQDVAWAIYYFNQSSNQTAVSVADQQRFDFNNDGSFDAADVLLSITDLNAATQAQAPAGENDLDALASLLAADAVAAKKKK